MSELVFAALRALGPRPGPDELETVARTVRETGGPEVRALFGLGAPVTEKEAWRRFLALVQERDETLQFVALDLLQRDDVAGWLPSRVGARPAGRGRITVKTKPGAVAVAAFGDAGSRGEDERGRRAGAPTGRSAPSSTAALPYR